LLPVKEAESNLLTKLVPQLEMAKMMGDPIAQAALPP
jgi:hypothetical protein